MKHLLSTEGLDRATATSILDTADNLKRALLGREVRKLPTLDVAKLGQFFPETRSSCRC